LATLTQEIEKHIRILVHPLKDEEALNEVLKVKLTKKEFKLLKAWADGQTVEQIREKLNLDEARYAELSSKLIKKLNQEKLKQEISL
jgi:DNA-binding NarL/FixJ family response regulator